MLVLNIYCRGIAIELDRFVLPDCAGSEHEADVISGPASSCREGAVLPTRRPLSTSGARPAAPPGT